MKQATSAALEKFLLPRMSSEQEADIRNAIETCVYLRNSEGKDSPELALHTIALLGLLEADLTPEEYDRAKGIILGDQSIAQDAAMRTLIGLREYREAAEELRPLLGSDILNYQTPAGLYCAGLRVMGLAVDEAPLDAARSMFRNIRKRGAEQTFRRNVSSSSETSQEEDSPLYGASLSRKA